MSKKILKQNIVLIIIAVAIAAVPLIILKNHEFKGADDQGGDAILEINNQYEPWAESLIDLGEGNLENILFAFQATLGAGVLIFCLAYIKRKAKVTKQ